MSSILSLYALPKFAGPLAHGVSDLAYHPFIPSSIHSFIHVASPHPLIHSSLHAFIPSSFHPFIHSSLHPLILCFGPFFPWLIGWLILCFKEWTGAHMGGAQGGLARQGPTLASSNTTLQLRLKIALVFDAVFLRFCLHLGSQDALENRPKSFKNHIRKCTPISKHFRTDVSRLFLRFSTPWGSTNLAKTL